ncbi:MAG: flagellar hook-length control protein FliK [Fimbriimonadaceae bacterium]|nr:flagellar hook-length control protein FliK [Fimbriimonadaceae bacterium]
MWNLISMLGAIPEGTTPTVRPGARGFDQALALVLAEWPTETVSPEGQEVASQEPKSPSQEPDFAPDEASDANATPAPVLVVPETLPSATMVLANLPVMALKGEPAATTSFDPVDSTTLRTPTVAETAASKPVVSSSTRLLGQTEVSAEGPPPEAPAAALDGPTEDIPADVHVADSGQEAPAPNTTAARDEATILGRADLSSPTRPPAPNAPTEPGTEKSGSPADIDGVRPIADSAKVESPKPSPTAKSGSDADAPSAPTPSQIAKAVRPTQAVVHEDPLVARDAEVLSRLEVEKETDAPETTGGSGEAKTGNGVPPTTVGQARPASSQGDAPRDHREAPTREGVAQIRERIEEMTLRRPQRMTIRLNPDSLGEITLTLKQVGSSLVADFAATDGRMRHALVEHRQALAASLELKQIQLQDFRVAEARPSHDAASNLADRRSPRQDASDPRPTFAPMRGSEPEVLATTPGRTWAPTGLDLWI